MREKNVIAFGVPEIADNVPSDKRRSLERERVKEVFDHVDADANDIITCLRIGKHGDKPRPLKIKIKCQNSKEKVLINARQLTTFTRENWNDRIFIKPDMTRRQKEYAKMLRQQLLSRNKKRGRSHHKEWKAHTSSIILDL